MQLIKSQVLYGENYSEMLAKNGILVKYRILITKEL